MNATNDDLEVCAREPIHIPGAIQPHGALFVLRPGDWTVVQASQNIADFVNDDVRCGEKPRALLAQVTANIQTWYQTPEPAFVFTCPELKLTGLAHRSDGRVIVEVEKSEGLPLDEAFTALRAFTQRLGAEAGIDRSLHTTAEFIQILTGFDRVLIYRFDDEWNGHVVAQAGNGNLPSYLGLRFPASDIPAQARALYASNTLRIIPDVNYRPVPVEPTCDPDTGKPLDLSHSQLRSVSPLHLEYMKNMGTGASMSVSIMVEGGLWGLISCHSAAAHGVSQPIRETCDFVAQSLAMRIGALDRAEKAARSLELGAVTSRLLAIMAAAPDWKQALAAEPEALMSQVGSSGAAIIDEDELIAVGEAPPETDIRALAAWLSEQAADEYIATSCLPSALETAERFAAVASGVLAIRISAFRSQWLIWFRPELVKTVKWGGDPHKHVQESGRIHPRKSFDAWRELVRMQSTPWEEAEIAAALNLRRAIVGIVLRKAEELAQITSELQRSNKELEAFSYSVSHDLRAPFRHIVGFAQLLREREKSLDEKSQHYLQTISDAAVSAGRLVDDLLSFSQLGRAAISSKPVDMNKLVAEVIKSLKMEVAQRQIEWQVFPLPDAWGDASLLRQVWYNLLDNAVKYTRARKAAKIVINGHLDGEIASYRVEDNGVGFDMAYVGKLFGVFQRLQRAEDFEGTGIGLALVRRIIERHNGSIRAEGKLDEGAVFTFALPVELRKVRAIA
ncbi:ATP-binding protein [Rhizobium helianthi]|uniref:histidine kinase n=1 Tax=Rhizobium helianthi TaxID=1132695 RepID=A0ABW4M7T1_9HYPH